MGIYSLIYPFEPERLCTGHRDRCIAGPGTEQEEQVAQEEQKEKTETSGTIMTGEHGKRHFLSRGLRNASVSGTSLATGYPGRTRGRWGAAHEGSWGAGTSPLSPNPHHRGAAPEPAAAAAAAATGTSPWGYPREHPDPLPLARDYPDYSAYGLQASGTSALRMPSSLIESAALMFNDTAAAPSMGLAPEIGPGLSFMDAMNLTSSSPYLPPSPTNGSLDIEQVLQAMLGSRYRSPVESVILTIVYSIIFLTGVVGNVSTCIVIYTNTYMHTATNYYLFTLAISDVLTLILGLPPELYTIWEAYPWRFGEPYCVFKVFLTEMTSCASILTIAAFTVERYVAICHPIRAQTMSSLSRAIRIIIGVWIAACISALPYPIHTRTNYYVLDPITGGVLEDSLVCNIKSDWIPRMRYVFQFSSFVLFLVPMTLITSLYVLIGITLRRSGLARQTSDYSGSPPHSQSRRAVLKMLVAVVVAFFICWAPFHAQRLMTVYIRDDEWTETLLEIQSILFYISGVLYFVSSTVNPILYNLMSRKYRQAFKETLCRCFLSPASRALLSRGGRSGLYVTERSTYMTHSGVHSRLPANRHSSYRASPLSAKVGHASNKMLLHPMGDGAYAKNGSRRCPPEKASITEHLLVKAGSDNRVNEWSKPTLVLPSDASPVVVACEDTNHVTTTTELNGRPEQMLHAAPGICDNNSSGSERSSPETIAAHLREELEMSSVR